jgi:hypothetical protein
MAAKPNLDQGNTAAKAKTRQARWRREAHEPRAHAPTAKARNVPSPYGKNKEAQTMRPNPTSVPPRDMPHDDRIHRELTTGKRSNSHTRSGR